MIALVRHDAEADVAKARGPTPVVIDLNDWPTVTSLLADVDAAIHTASPRDATSAGLDSAVMDAATGAFAGSGKSYLHISGDWTYGNNTAITEDSPFHAPHRVLSAIGSPVVTSVPGGKSGVVAAR